MDEKNDASAERRRACAGRGVVFALALGFILGLRGDGPGNGTFANLGLNEDGGLELVLVLVLCVLAVVVVVLRLMLFEREGESA